MTCEVLLPAGQIVKVNGIPLKLSGASPASTHPANVPLVFKKNAPLVFTDETATVKKALIGPTKFPRVLDAEPGPDPVANAATSPEIPAESQGFVAAAFGRRPIRDRVRAGLIRAVRERAGVPVGESEVDEAISEALDLSKTGLIDWLADGGLERLIQAILAILKLAA